MSDHVQRTSANLIRLAPIGESLQRIDQRVKHPERNGVGQSDAFFELSLESGRTKTVTNVQVARRAILEALAPIGDEMRRHEHGEGKISDPAQLGRIQSALIAALERADGADLAPQGERSLGLGRVITDSWPFDSELGEVIIRAEHAFINIALS